MVTFSISRHYEGAGLGLSIARAYVKMPEMDGYEVTRKIREFNKKVIFFTENPFNLNKSN